MFWYVEDGAKWGTDDKFFQEKKVVLEKDILKD